MKPPMDPRTAATLTAAQRARDATLTAEDEAALAWARDAFPKPADLPPGWRLVNDRPIDGYHVVSADRLSVICSGSVEADGKRWLHVSYARPGRMPDYADTQRVRTLFLSADRYCCAIYPPKDRYVSLHRFCLHLWSCLDDWPLPELSGHLGGIRSI